MLTVQNGWLRTPPSLMPGATSSPISEMFTSASISVFMSMAIIGVSIPLPWIAVLIANDRPPRSKDEPSRWDGRRADIAATEALEAPKPHVIDG